ncbi:MAG TPA: hypothetical protein VK829_12365 [Terriglobales bacterium]|jgi:hypothetical protein|nr:hypothetical protein [Terriglobales bacterium]
MYLSYLISLISPTLPGALDRRRVECPDPVFNLKIRRVILQRRDVVFLLGMTAAALFVHGYHPRAEDAAIYLPGVEKILNHQLFPFNSQFFESHAHLTFFPNLIAISVRLTHLPLLHVLFFWHLISIFLLLCACWELSQRVFNEKIAFYAGVALVAGLLTLPVAGTALYIMDQYVNPRNLTAFVGVLAIAKVLDRKYLTALLLLLFSAAIHPLMSVFAFSFCILLLCVEKFQPWQPTVACLLPLGLLDPPGAAYHEVALTRSYFYPLQWQWYEWLGVIGPLAILWWFSRIARTRRMKNLELLSRTLVLYQVIFVIASLVVSVPPRFESLARLQPMRSLYLLYILFVLFSGGLLGQFVLKDRWWRWMALFLPLCAGMFYAQRALFSDSAHVEWPGAAPRNPWAQAFEWVRANTPPDAIFALDPQFMHIRGEDENGFRATAQRSMLADGNTDSGAVTMFPQMADEWLKQVQAENGWHKFQLQDFRRLHAQYGVNWVVLQQPGVAGLECPYQNSAVRICRVD